MRPGCVHAPGRIHLVPPQGDKVDGHAPVLQVIQHTLDVREVCLIWKELSVVDEDAVAVTVGHIEEGG